MAALRRKTARLPVVLLATLLAVGIPLAVLWTLSETETVGSLTLLALIAVALAIAVALVGEAACRRSGVQLNELMLWGWIRSLFYDRRLDRAWERIQQPGEMSTREMAECFRELSESLDAADAYTSGHSRRVAHYCDRIARHLGLDAAQVSHLRIAAAIHDVGKVNTPPEILRKPARLTETEYETIKRHSADGAQMVARLADPELTSAVRHHHERIDGSGYPEGLIGTQIPIEARIIAVADSFDAITSNRPYRPARSRRAALEILRAEAGTKLDADAVRALSTRSLTAWSAITRVPERGIAAMGGAVNTLSASTAAAVVAGIAVIGIGVANPAGVANVVRDTPLPGVIEAIVPGGGGNDKDENPDLRDAQPVRLAAAGTAPTALAPPPPAPEPAAAIDDQAGPGKSPSERGRGEGPKEPEPSPPGLGPGLSPLPEPPPEPPPREPGPLDPVLDVLPTPLGNAVKALTDPLLPPR